MTVERGAWVAWAFFAAFVGGPALLYVVAAETTRTRLVIATVLVVLAAAAAVLRQRRRIGAVLALLGGAFGAVALARVPSGAGEGAARSLYTKENPYPRYRVSNVIPEIDQMKFGTYLAPALDPIITFESASKLRALTMGLYRAMDADPAFAPLGSAMSYAYDNRDSGHLYTYVPAHEPGERLGALVFLHGSGGNFKVYTHLLASVAEQERVVVVAPSFGFGNWQQEGGTAAIERARRHAVDVLGADPDRIVLAGLSNGGRGITRALAENGEAYTAVIAISAVLETDVIDRAKAHAHRMPALVIYGAADDRIDSEHEEDGAAALTLAGLYVRTHAYESEDHFLLFARRDEVMSEVASFVHEVLAR